MERSQILPDIVPGSEIEYQGQKLVVTGIHENEGSFFYQEHLDCKIIETGERRLVDTTSYVAELESN